MPSPGRNFYLSLNKDQYRRHSLDEEDYEYFEFKLPAGTLVLHYVELGKDFVDLYEDNLPLTYANFKNLHFYSGESSLMLTEFDSFKDIGYLEWLKSNNIDPLDKKLGHGKIPLGKIDNLVAVRSIIQQYKHIKNIIIKE